MPLDSFHSIGKTLGCKSNILQLFCDTMHMILKWARNSQRLLDNSLKGRYHRNLYVDLSRDSWEYLLKFWFDIFMQLKCSHRSSSNNFLFPYCVRHSKGLVDDKDCLLHYSKNQKSIKHTYLYWNENNKGHYFFIFKGLSSSIDDQQANILSNNFNTVLLTCFLFCMLDQEVYKHHQLKNSLDNIRYKIFLI